MTERKKKKRKFSELEVFYLQKCNSFGYFLDCEEILDEIGSVFAALEKFPELQSLRIPSKSESLPLYIVVEEMVTGYINRMQRNLMNWLEKELREQTFSEPLDENLPLSERIALAESRSAKWSKKAIEFAAQMAGVETNPPSSSD